MNKQTDVNGLVEEARVRKDAEDEARHVMGAVPIILEAAVIVPVACLFAAILVILFR